jgi:hypothetical protein
MVISVLFITDEELKNYWDNKLIKTDGLRVWQVFMIIFLSLGKGMSIAMKFIGRVFMGVMHVRIGFSRRQPKQKNHSFKQLVHEKPEFTYTMPENTQGLEIMHARMFLRKYPDVEQVFYGEWALERSALDDLVNMFPEFMGERKGFMKRGNHWFLYLIVKDESYE